MYIYHTFKSRSFKCNTYLLLLLVPTVYTIMYNALIIIIEILYIILYYYI